MKPYKQVIFLIGIMLVVGCEMGADETTRMSNAQQSLIKNDDRTAMIELKSILQDNPENGKARRLLGELYLRQGNGMAAQKELSRAQRLGENEVRIALLLAQAFILKNEFDEALKWLSLPDAAAAAQQSEAALMRGDIYVAQAMPQQAKDAYSTAKSVSPDSESGQLADVKRLLLNNELKPAATRIAGMLSQYPESVEGWLLQGAINSNLVDHTAARMSYEAALNATDTKQHTRFGLQARLGIIKASLAQADEAVASNHINVLLTQLPNHPLPKYFDALLAYQQQDYDKASERLLQVLAVMARHLPSQLLMGATQYALGQYEQANQYLTHVVSAMPDHQQARKMLAAVHMKLQSPQAAVKVLEPVIGKESTNVELLRMVGLAALSAGDMDGGERYLNRALEQGESGAIRTDLAKIHLAKGEYDEAIKALEQVSGDATLQASMMIALTHMKKGDINKAKDAAKKLAVDYPEEAVVYALMGGVHQSQGDSDMARVSYQQSLTKNRQFVPALLELARLDLAGARLAEAEEYFKQVISAEPGNLRAYFGLAQVAERNNDMKQALNWMERARAHNPAAIEPVRVLARHYIKNKQLDKAASVVTEGIKASPDNALFMRMNAQIKFDQGHKAEAVDVLKRAVEKKPEDAALVIMLASMQRQSGHEEQARQSLLKGLRVVPDGRDIEIALINQDIASADYDDAKARIGKLKKQQQNRAVAYALEGHLNMVVKKYAAAATAFQSAFGLNPSYQLLSKLMQAKHKLGKLDEIGRDVSRWFSLATSNLAHEDKVASAYMQLGENRRAIQHYEAVVKRNTAHVPALNNLAWLYALDADPRAIATARQAYQLAPGSSDVTDTLGWVLVKSGQYQEGIERLREALRLGQGNDEITLHLVEALLESGAEKGEAKQLLREALARNPELQNRKDVRRLSSQLGF